jgi:DNA-binding protein YbaB
MMGFFKNMHDLNKQAREIQKEMGPVGDRMAQAQERMAQAQQFMAAQTQAANAATSGVPVPVTITGARQVGMMNFEPMMEFELTVMPESGPPYPATARQTVSEALLPALQPGTTLTGHADLNDRTSVWLDVLSLGS